MTGTLSSAALCPRMSRVYSPWLGVIVSTGGDALPASLAVQVLSAESHLALGCGGRRQQPLTLSVADGG